MRNVVELMHLTACLGVLVLTLLVTPAHCTQKLHFDWTAKDLLHSPMAKLIHQHQSVCTKKVFYYHQNNWGMGSDLHTWTQAVCNSMQKESTLLEQNETWIWNDKAFCGSAYHKQPLTCYFNLEKHCPNSEMYPEPYKMMSFNHSYDRCPKYIQDDRTRQEFRAAAVEYLFSNLNHKLIHAAESAIVNVFGEEGIPENLMTVHLRWGDKKREMKLVSQEEFVDAITVMAAGNNIFHPKVFVTTESKDALHQLQAYVRQHRPSWTLYKYLPSVYEGGGHAGTPTSPMNMARYTNGVIGKASLIALLFALEAKYYVLTSGSNWSRLIDELRRNIIDRKCGGCTRMVDLRQAFSDHNWRRI